MENDTSVADYSNIIRRTNYSGVGRILKSVGGDSFVNIANQLWGEWLSLYIAHKLHRNEVVVNHALALVPRFSLRPEHFSGDRARRGSALHLAGSDGFFDQCAHHVAIASVTAC